MVELNTSYILNAPTEIDFLQSMNEVCCTTTPLLDGNENGMEDTGFRMLFERQIRRLLRNTTTPRDPSRVQDARDILAFARDASRPLRLIELLHLLALRHSTKRIVSNALRAPRDLMLTTHGLIKIDTDDTVHFIHPWLRRYLREDCCRRHDFPNAHQRLAELSVKYMTGPQVPASPCNSLQRVEDTVRNAPFWTYAIANLHRHYNSAPPCESREKLRESIMSFFRRQGSVTCAQQLIGFIGKQMHDQQRVLNSTQSKIKDVEPSFTKDNSTSKWLNYHELSWSDSHKTTSLHLAILLGLDDIAVQILSEQDQNWLSATNGLEETPLHLAVVCSSDEPISQLIRQGSDLNARDRLGMSPWHVAAACGNVIALSILCHAVNRLQFNARVEPSTSQQSARTEFTESAWTNKAISGSTALHLAARAGHLESVKLITADERSDWTIEDRYGMTAFHKACKYGRLEIVRHFTTRRPCARFQSTIDGRIGLHLACKYESGLEVAKFLLEMDPTLCNVKDNNDETALHHSVRGLEPLVVDLLLNNPMIDVNSTNRKGQTPIMLAVYNPSNVFELLLDHSKLDKTSKSGSLSVVELVEQRSKVLDSRLAMGRVISSSDRGCYRGDTRLAHVARSLREDDMRSFTPESSWLSNARPPE